MPEKTSRSARSRIRLLGERTLIMSLSSLAFITYGPRAVRWFTPDILLSYHSENKRVACGQGSSIIAAPVAFEDSTAMGVACERNANRRVGVYLTAVCWVAGLGGCGASAFRSEVSLESPDPSARAAAIVRAADRHDQSAVPLLVDRLEDEDEAVRFYAILALDRLTGTRLGYEYGGPEMERRASVERWRRFLVASRQGAGTAEHPAEP